MRDRRFKPLRNQPTKAPSQLADLDGRRKPGGTVKMSSTKPPKARYKPEQVVEYQGSFWKIVYMYRVKANPGAWMHCIEEIREAKSSNDLEVAGLFQAIGAGATTPRIVYEEFVNENDASSFFGDIYRNGDQSILTTQRMINETKLVNKND